LGEWGFSTFFAPVTLTLTRCFHIQTWPLCPGDMALHNITTTISNTTYLRLRFLSVLAIHNCNRDRL